MELDKLVYGLQKKDSRTMHEYEMCQRANRIRFTLLENHGFTLKQHIEAVFLLEGVLMKDIQNKRKAATVNKAIAKVYQSFQWLRYYTFAEIIGATQSRVYKLAKSA